MTWIKGHKACKPAGSRLSNGHSVIMIKGKIYSKSRVCWIYAYGDQPDKIVFRDGNKDNFCLYNLQSVSQSILTHRLKRALNPFGIQKNRIGKWEARIWMNGKPKHLGTYQCPVLAKCAYETARPA